MGLSPGQSSGSLCCAGTVQQGVRPWQLGDGSDPGQIRLLGRSGSASPFTRGFLRRRLRLSGSGAAFGQNTELGRASGADVGGLGRCVFEAPLQVAQGWISG
ncbi:unnamed protein product [Pipistrellus nathusii]|uniref:Uncharacterized protein n=1 Tax=Pipistrellus nathusii TaxID=59473 RepID=A0ABN9Z999_PIPNA